MRRIEKRKKESNNSTDRYADYVVDWYEERGEASITVYDADYDEVLWSAEDEFARELVEDGFIKYFGDTASLIKYLSDMNILQEGKSQNTITLPEDVEIQLEDRTVILEKGDRVRVLTEEFGDKFRKGDKVVMTDVALENYGYEYEGKVFTVESASYSQKDHPGYDSGMEGEGLYDLVGFPNSLYSYELTYA